MSAVPGSLPWLLRHEVKLQWRATASKLPVAAALVMLLVVFHLVGLLLAVGFNQMPPIPQRYLLIGVTGAALAVFLLMLSMGLVAAMQAIYQRGDMSLLLTAPIDPRSIMFVRVGALTLNLLAGSCALMLPFANMFAIFVTPKWLYAYAAIPALGLLAASVGLGAALGLFRLLGARRARLYAQILGALIGVGAAILMQLPNLLSKEAKASLGQWFADFANSLPASDSLVWLPARAFTGDLPMLAIIVAAACGLFALVVFRLADHFIASAIAVSGGEAGVARRHAGRVRAFRTETVSVMRRKELRLIARDPWLLIQVGQQMIYLAPALVSMWQNSSAASWMMLVLVAGMLGSALAWLTISGEDAPDLLAVAPVPPAAALRAKLEAALLPVVLALMVPVAVAAWSDGWLALTLMVCGTASAASGALLHVSCPRPGKRSEFAKRHKGRWGIGILEFALSAAWTAAASLMLHHMVWALLPALIVVVPLAIRLYGRIERRAPVMLPAGALAA